MTNFDSLPIIRTETLEDQFAKLSEVETSWQRIQLINSIRQRLPEAWRKYQAKFLEVASSWDSHRAQLLATEHSAEKHRLSQIDSELSRKIRDAEARGQTATRDREILENEIAGRFDSTWGTVAGLLRENSDDAHIRFSYNSAAITKSDANAVDEWRSAAQQWRKNSVVACQLMSKEITFGVPIIAVISAFAAIFVFVYHPAPGVSPILALLVSILSLVAFVRYRPSFKAKTLSAIKDAHRLATRAVHSLREIESAELSLIGLSTTEIRESHSREVKTIRASTQENIAAIEATYVVRCRQFDTALHQAVQRIRSIDASILRLTEQERSSLDRVASDLTEESAFSISQSITMGEQLHVRFGMTEYPEVPLFSADAGDVAKRLGKSLPKVVCEKLSVPHLWTAESKRSLIVHDHHPAADGFAEIAELITTRLMRQVTPGKLLFTFFDPIGLGRTFSSVLKLSDYDETLISGRVWSTRDHFRRQLKDLIEHIEVVIQRYLRNDFEDIDQYNDIVAEIAEPYRFVLLADFPDGFDEESFKDLVRILQNGPRCGVFAIVHINDSRECPRGIYAEILDAASIVATRFGDTRSYAVAQLKADTGHAPPVTQGVAVDGLPTASVTKAIVEGFGTGAQSAKLVEVPYESIFPPGDSCWWSKTTAEGISVPLGPSGARRFQHLELGKGTSHHVLVVGRPGSGKSNLIHVFITAMARLYPPDELSLYLIDFKKGVEFKSYADWKLPHARVIAIESEREFGFNVLEGVNAELARRGELFRKESVSSLVEYRSKTKAILPRIVLIIDEFQELFSADDRLKRDATQLLDRLIRQGRAFGIHLMLATQSLTNSGLDRSTQDQMGIRIALQCSETDSRLILAQDNIAARRLSRPGEAIYNDAVGLVEGNKPFQVALFSDVDRESVLRSISEKARNRGMLNERVVVFEGHDAARIELCQPYLEALHASPPMKLSAVRLWLGEPIALKPTLLLELKRQTGHNLLLVTRDEKEAFGLLGAVLLSAIASTAQEQCHIRVLDFSSADVVDPDYFIQLSNFGGHDVQLSERRDTKALLGALADEIGRRQERGEEDQPRILFVIFGIQRARDLRDAAYERLAESNAVKVFAKVLREGPEVGVHTLVWCDTFPNLERILVERRTLNSFSFRVSGPLPAQESQQLFGDQVASLINRPHRLVSHYDEKVGVFDLFRPFGPSSRETLAGFLDVLRQRSVKSMKTTEGAG